MLLPAEEATLFFSLHGALMQFVNEQLKIVGAQNAKPSSAAFPPEKRREVVLAFVGRLDLIDAFIAANPAGFSPEQLDIVSSWRHLVSGQFIALRQLKKHMVLLACKGPPTAFGLVGLTHPPERVIGQPLPAMIETVLLPFRGRIIYDGLISSLDVTFGPGSRRAFEADCRLAKASNRVLTSLPEAPLSFQYNYDFGDDWVHDVLYEGCPPLQPGTVYPQCLEGERACPPEDVGGTRGYAEYLEAMADPNHDCHQEMLAWRGPFNPDAFDPRRTTHVMQEGMPDWREMDGPSGVEA